MDGDGDTSNYDDYPDDGWRDAMTSNGHPFDDFWCCRKLVKLPLITQGMTMFVLSTG